MVRSHKVAVADHQLDRKLYFLARLYMLADVSFIVRPEQSFYKFVIDIYLGKCRIGLLEPYCDSLSIGFFDLYSLRELYFSGKEGIACITMSPPTISLTLFVM